MLVLLFGARMAHRPAGSTGHAPYVWGMHGRLTVTTQCGESVATTLSRINNVRLYLVECTLPHAV